MEELVNEQLEKHLKPLKLVQQSHLTGTAVESGAQK